MTTRHASGRLDAHLRDLKVTASPERLAVIGLPLSAWPTVQESGFADPRTGASLISSPQELTLVVPWGRVPVARGLFPGLRVEGPFRQLTLGATRDAEATPSRFVPGFLARVTRVLADADIPTGVLSSYSTDHVLVRDEDADDAVTVLASLAAAAREATAVAKGESKG